MNSSEQLVVPNTADEAAQYAPIVQSLANTIAAIACVEGFISPRRLQGAIASAQAVGNVIGQANLTRLLVFRALGSPPEAGAAFAALKPLAKDLPVSDRAAILRALEELLSAEFAATTSLASEIAAALRVPVPEALRREGSGIRDALGGWADRVKRAVSGEPPLLAAARGFVTDFGEFQLAGVITEAQRSGDVTALAAALRNAVRVVQGQGEALAKAAEAQAEALEIAKDLDVAADRIEQVAIQRHAAMTRRATMLKRHLREDLHALVEDAAEEFEVDFRRMAEAKKSWFGHVETADLNDRLVVKNLERRYARLSHRYQDQLDLLEREVSEYRDEFTRAFDEALAPIARHEFRDIAPSAQLELRLKAAADQASGRALTAGAVGVAATGAAMHTGLVAMATVAGAAASPVGIVVLGAVAVAGVWKVFSAPGERRQRDVRARAADLETGLRKAIMEHLPRFEKAVDATVSRFSEAVVPDIVGPRVEAARLREISEGHRAIAGGVVRAMNVRLNRLAALLESVETPPPP